MINSISLSRAVATATAVLGACLLAFASPAAGYTPPLKTGSEDTPLNLKGSGSATTHAASSSAGPSIVRTIVGLAIVIAVIWGLAWILRQVKAGKEGGRDFNQSDGLASVAALTLGSGRSVHLVRAGSDYVLVGATEHGVAPIHHYTEQEAREAGLPIPDPSEESPRGSGLGALIAGAGRALVGPRLTEQPLGSVRNGAGSDARRAADQGMPMLGEQFHHSPAVGARPDPMRAHAPSAGVIDRLREMTVRR
jgi:flagellar protein FliO/FliZ